MVRGAEAGWAPGASAWFLCLARSLQGTSPPALPGNLVVTLPWRLVV